MYNIDITSPFSGELFEIKKKDGSKNKNRLYVYSVQPFSRDLLIYDKRFEKIFEKAGTVVFDHPRQKYKDLFEAR